MKHPIFEANEENPFGLLSPEEFYAKHGVVHSTEYFTNPQGLRIFTQSWRPIASNSTVHGVVAVIHGFTSESSWIVQLTAIMFASSGFLVCAIDHQGHGFSEGLLYHIPDITTIVDDCVQCFTDFRQKNAPSLPAFLYGESLGAAISLYVVLRQKTSWDGVVLNGAMCGISDRFKPPWPLEHLLFILAKLIPTWHVVPTRGNIPGVSFKVEWKKKLAVASPRRILVRPRASTALELIRVCKELNERFEEVDVPLLIVHGECDVVCDPACVKALYARASSEDKTLKIYPGALHQLVGEPEESVDSIFGDVVDWLKTRATAAGAGAPPTR